jgi:hypothetical protein
LWREQYSPNFENFKFDEFLEIFTEYTKSIFSNKFSFYLRHVKEEGKKLYRPFTLSEAMKLTSLFD